METCLKAITIPTRRIAKGRKARNPSNATGTARAAVLASGRPKIVAARTSIRVPLKKALIIGNSIAPKIPLTGPWALTRKRSIVPETSSWRTVTGITPIEMVRIWTITSPITTNPK